MGPTGRVVAEDIFDDFLAAPSNAPQKQKLGNVTFIKGTETDPNLPDGRWTWNWCSMPITTSTIPRRCWRRSHKALKPDGKLVIVDYYKREGAMPNGRALTHIRLDMPDVIKEMEANHFHLIMEKEHIKNVQYMLDAGEELGTHEEFFPIYAIRGPAADSAAAVPSSAPRRNPRSRRRMPAFPANRPTRFWMSCARSARCCSSSRPRRRGKERARRPGAREARSQRLPDARVEVRAGDDGGVHRLSMPLLPAVPHSVFGELKKNYIDTGKVRFYSRDLPLDPDPSQRHPRGASRPMRGRPGAILEDARHDGLAPR